MPSAVIEKARITACQNTVEQTPARPVSNDVQPGSTVTPSIALSEQIHGDGLWPRSALSGYG